MQCINLPRPPAPNAIPSIHLIHHHFKSLFYILHEVLFLIAIFVPSLPSRKSLPDAKQTIHSSDYVFSRTLELKRNAKRQTDSQKQTQKCPPISLSAPDAMPRVEIASKCPSSQICSRTNLSGMIQSPRRDISFVCSFGRLPTFCFLWVYILCC